MENLTRLPARCPLHAVLVWLIGSVVGSVFGLVVEIAYLKRAHGLTEPFTPFGDWLPVILTGTLSAGAWEATWINIGLAVGVLVIASAVVLSWSVYSLITAWFTTCDPVDVAKFQTLAWLPGLLVLAYPLTTYTTPSKAFAEAGLLVVCAHTACWLRLLWKHGIRSDVREGMLPRLLFRTAFIFYVMIHLGGYFGKLAGPDGDEPHTLLTVHSLWYDGDADLSNNLQQRDYADYYKWSFTLHGTERDGRQYSQHGVGFPALILPAYALGGYVGVLILLSMLAAFVAERIYNLALRITEDSKIALRCWILMAFSAPLVLYSGQVHPETAAALIVLLVFFHLCFSSDDHGGYDLLIGLGIAVLPWLYVRYIPLAAGLAFLLVADRLRMKSYRLPVIVSVLFTAGLGSLCLYTYFRYGTPWPLAGFMGGSESVTAHIGSLISAAPHAGLAGLWIDQRYGLLAYNPIYILALLGIPLAVEKYRRPAIYGLIIIGVMWISMGLFVQWPGGYAPPSRFLVCVVPLLAIPLAAWLARPERSFRRYLTSSLAAISYSYAVIMIVATPTRYNIGDYAARSSLVEFIEAYTTFDVGFSFPVLYPYISTTAYVTAGGLLLALTALFYLDRKKI